MSKFLFTAIWLWRKSDCRKAMPSYDIVFIALVVWGIKTHLSSPLWLHGYLSYKCYYQDNE